MGKLQEYTQFLTFKELQEESAFLKVVAQVFEAGDFPNIFLRFLGCVFEVRFLIKKFLLKKRVLQ